jgi:hypothetical protein
VEGCVLLFLYGINKAWYYEGNDTYFHGNIKLSHIKLWWVLGLLIELGYRKHLFPFSVFLANQIRQLITSSRSVLLVFPLLDLLLFFLSIFRLYFNQSLMVWRNQSLMEVKEVLDWFLLITQIEERKRRKQSASQTEESGADRLRLI